MKVLGKIGRDALLSSIKGGLIVSCQPVPGSRFDTPETLAVYTLVAETCGAVAVRVEGVVNTTAAKQATNLPILGIVKRDLSNSPIRITPFVQDVRDLHAAGAKIVAVDCTDRSRPVPFSQLLAEIKRLGAIAMADISNFEEAKAAIAGGADIIGTTMSGYTGDVPTPNGPDVDLVRKCSGLGIPVFAEGRYNTPEFARAARLAGADAVVVGAAITRPEHVIGWFRAAVERPEPEPPTVLTFDIGGTKTLAALVRNGVVLQRKVMPSSRVPGTKAWLEALRGLVDDWEGQFHFGSAAVTGVVRSGMWNSLNPTTLAIPGDYPLARNLREAFGCEFEVVNDAQAAAWGEYRFGAGKGRDMAFLTVSSGIGGGIVLGGRLLRGHRGLAGSVGQFPVRLEGDARPLESFASGFGIAVAARSQTSEKVDAKTVFEAQTKGASWAEEIILQAVNSLATAIAQLQATVDPEVVVIGGGVGLAPGFIEMTRAAFSGIPSFLVPVLVPAGLGADAGIVGASDLIFQKMKQD